MNTIFRKIFRHCGPSLLILLGIFIFWQLKLRHSYRQQKFWQQQGEKLQISVSRAQRMVARKKYFIRKMMTDPQFRERVAREQVDFAKPDEYIIFFKGHEEQLRSSTDVQPRLSR